MLKYHLLWNSLYLEVNRISRNIPLDIFSVGKMYVYITQKWSLNDILELLYKAPDSHNYKEKIQWLVDTRQQLTL